MKFRSFSEIPRENLCNAKTLNDEEKIIYLSKAQKLEYVLPQISAVAVTGHKIIEVRRCIVECPPVGAPKKEYFDPIKF